MAIKCTGTNETPKKKPLGAVDAKITVHLMASHFTFHERLQDDEKSLNWC